MSAPQLVHRPSTRGIVAVWVVALLAGIAVAIWAPDERLMLWMLLALGGAFEAIDEMKAGAKAAKALGIDVSWLYKKLKKHNITAHAN